MTFACIATQRGIWPTEWLCEALGVSPAGFYVWRTRSPSARVRAHDQLLTRVRASFLASDRTYRALRAWHDLLADGVSCGRHRIERLRRQAALRAGLRRRRVPSDAGARSTKRRRAKGTRPDIYGRVGPSQMGRRLHLSLDRRRLALYVASVVDLFSRRVVGWSMQATLTTQLLTDALVTAICRRGKPKALLHHSDRESQYTSEPFQRLLADHGVTTQGEQTVPHARPGESRRV